ncbi:hypothetical protein GM51_4400 [freshwater metagenome]|uniref:DUF2142 domain-containing protein n=1 Tax=freshwater metagenome TaxID=449393 RepID=A0A094SQL3_9ZZZZ
MKLPAWFARVRWIAALPVLVFVALGAWAFTSPVGASPDDNFHLGSTWCAGGDRPGLCAPGTKPTERRVDAGLVRSGCYATDPKVSAGCQADQKLFSENRTVLAKHGSWNGGYPPVYYAVMNVFASPNIEVSVMVIRFVNILFFVLSGVALWLLLPVATRRPLLLMWTVTTLPLGLFLIPSNNPSSWAITAVPTAFLALYGFLKLRGRGLQRTLLGAVFALEVIAASGARADAAAFTVVGSVAAIALCWRRDRLFFYSLIIPAIMAGVAFAFFINAGQAAAASEGLRSGDGEPGQRSFWGVLVGNITRVPFLWQGAFGGWGLGWLDTPMPTLVSLGSTGVIVAVLFFAIGKSLRSRIWTAAAITFLAAAVPLYVLQRNLNYVGEQVQPRYILPLLIVVAGVILLAFERRRVTFTRPQAWILGAVLIPAGSLALFTNLKRYTHGLGDEALINLDATAEWWWSMPISPLTVWVVGSVSYTLVIIAVLYLSRRGGRVRAQQTISVSP